MQRVDQRAEAQRIAQNNQFLAKRRAFLAHRGQERNALQPLLRSQIDLARKLVQVPHQGFHDPPQPRIRSPGHLLDDLVSNRVVVDGSHENFY